MNKDINSAEVTKSDLRKFGFIMGIMVILLFGLLLPWIFDKTLENWPIWPFIVMAVFWGLALLVPWVLQPVYNIWMKFGHVMGWINSRIILGIMFYLLIFPIGLILKLLGKDSMKRKFENDLNSYRRVTRSRDKSHLEKPF